MDERIESGCQEPGEQRDSSMGGADQLQQDVPPSPPPWPGVGDQSVTIYRPRLFFRKDLGFWKYLAIMGPMSLVPSLIIAFALTATGLLTEEMGPDFSSDAVPPAIMAVSVIVVSPVIETLAMAGIIWLLSFATGNKTKLAVLSAIVWGIIHSLAAPMWGPVIMWPFFVFSCGYLNWKDKSLGLGLLMGMALHCFQNILPGILIAVGVE